MFFPAPQVVTACMWVGTWLLLSVTLLTSEVLIGFWRPWITRHIPTKPLVVVAPPLVVAAVLGVLWVPLHGYAEGQLWESGNFGESPRNRLVRVTSLPNLNSVLFEFSVKSNPVHGVNLLLDIGDAYAKERTQVFFQRSGLLVPPTSPEERHQLPSYFWPDEGKVFRFRSDELAVTQQISLYVLLELDGNATLRGCGFSSFYEDKIRGCRIEQSRKS